MSSTTTHRSGRRRTLGLAGAAATAALVAATPALAGSDTTPLPNGADLTVTVDSPVTGDTFVVPAGDTTVDVPLSGTASVATGAPSVSWVYVIDVSGSTANPCTGSTTVLESLCIDIRIYGNRTAKWSSNQCPPERTSWAICAALKRLFDGDTLMRPINASSAPGPLSTNITIDELILNVVSPRTSKSVWLPADYPSDVATYGVVHPRTVAKELLDMWNIIWTGEDFKGSYYHVLLQRIKRVKISVDGETWRVRDLGMELERGQAESRRLAMRGVR